MTTAHREALRLIMNLACSFRREDPADTFATCLRRVWAFTKRSDAYAAKFMRRAAGARTVALSPSLIQSPIGRASRTLRYGRRADWNAALLTAKLGL